MLLEFKNISKSFSDTKVLDDISFSVEQGKVLALMGENGAGKSTLMKILSGIITEYEGEIILNNEKVNFRTPKDAEQKGISIIHQELNVVPDLSVGENIFIGKEPASKIGFINYNKMYAEAEMILKEFGFSFSAHTKVRNLSIGSQQMVEIARTLHLNSGIIIMDEPTSALSEHEADILFDKIRQLKEKGKTIIYISHRMKEIFDIADQVAVMRDGKFIAKKNCNEINRDQLIELMIGREVSDNPNKQQVIGTKMILEVKGLSVHQDTKKILSDISFNVQEGEVMGIAGLLGAGRTELLKFLYGALDVSYEGKIKYKNESYQPGSIAAALKKKIIYLSEDRKGEGLFIKEGIKENASASVLDRFSRMGFLNLQDEAAEVDVKLQEFGVKMKSSRQAVNTLSGGNQQKVLLGRVLLVHPHLLLLDEPTRGVDIGAKYEIYALIEQLRKEGLAIILTSSEIPELLQICSKILVLSEGHQTAMLNAADTDSQEILHYAFKKK